MTIQHLRGSLAQNILDITKGGGCPKIKPWNKRYSVLRYFSRMKDDTIPAVSGVIGDGGYFNDSSYPPAYDGTFYYLKGGTLNKNLNLNDNLPYVAASGGVGYPGTFVGSNNYLNICNRRELLTGSADDYINDAGSNSIQNIELANDVIEKDGSGYYNYNLYKKAHTMDITPAGTSTPVSKTAELMEFVYLHAYIAACRTGELYIEIEDFDLTGATTNDYLIYCYYWETTRDKSSIADAFRNVNNYLSSNANLLLTDQSNTCCKVFKLSDVKGTGTDNKLIIWLNKNKTRNEKFAVNCLIGLKPQDLRRDERDPERGGLANALCTYDECDDIVFKFKKATIKNKKFATVINNQPMAYPNFGYKGLINDTYSDDTHYIQVPISARNSAYNALPINDQTNIVDFGVPNGGAIVSSSFLWTNGPGVFGGSVDIYPGISFLDSCIRSFYLYAFHKTNKELDDSQSYILKLPPLTNFCKYKLNNSTPNIYITPSSDFVINIYAGSALQENAGGEYFRYKDLIDSLILLESFSISDLASSVTVNSGETNSSIPGSPYVFLNEMYVKKNKYKYLNFTGAELSSLSQPIYFYMSVERSSQPIKTISYAPVGDGDPPPFTFYYPSGYTNTGNLTAESAQIGIITEYVRARYDSGVNSTLVKNYDAMIYKAPQIIAKTATPTAENYFV